MFFFFRGRRTDKKCGTIFMKRTIQLQSMQRLPNQLGDVPAEFYRTESVQDFMHSCSGWIMNFARVRLTRDPDVAGDFYVFFYERAGRCLEAYKTRQHLPFTGYLATYLRHEFYNFIRLRRRKTVAESPLDESRVEAAASGSSDSHIVDRLMELPMDLRIPLKLHHGIDLNGAELRAMALSRGASETQGMLREMARRKLTLFKEQEKLEERAARLNHLLHKSSDDRLRKWKERVLEALSRHRPVFSYTEIARLLGTSKSTIARRIDSAREQIRVQARVEAV